MFTFKCLSCGADLEFEGDRCTCRHCGTDNYLDFEGKKVLAQRSRDTMVRKNVKFMSFPAFIRDRLPGNLKLVWYKEPPVGFAPGFVVAEVVRRTPGFLLLLSGLPKEVADLNPQLGYRKVTVRDPEYTQLFANLAKEYLRYCGRRVEVIENVTIKP